MNTFRLLFALAIFALTLAGCKKDDGTTPGGTTNSQTELLVANNWRMKRVSDVANQEINRNRLNLTTQVIYDLDMQFRNNGTVRALDPKQSGTVVNGGSWKLTTDNQSIDVDVQGFKGIFPIIQLTRNKLVLRQRAPVDGKDADINLEFDPSL
ncbi:hypothetical protein IC229_21220 [Spirosoma sp. BT702]|uniref:Lipocalin-like domain-containing protein n=1 Tax=Spirosoma profusum TaxID=2771354 RepID=A0A927AS22_9BACT|nr:hypothetical protein [Spirosoma profusum]MBD2703181.1 hypothetical protein [Spirosoma profusum]